MWPSSRQQGDQKRRVQPLDGNFKRMVVFLSSCLFCCLRCGLMLGARAATSEHKMEILQQWLRNNKIEWCWKPWSCNSVLGLLPGWDRPKPEARSFTQVFHRGGRAQVLVLSSSAFLGALERNWIRGGAAGTQASVDMGCWQYTW